MSDACSYIDKWWEENAPELRLVVIKQEAAINLLQQRIEELEKEHREIHAAGLEIGCHLITTEQIDAAWKQRIEKFAADSRQPSIYIPIDQIGIESCAELCDEGAEIYDVVYADRKCDYCNGHGWVKEADDE